MTFQVPVDGERLPLVYNGVPWVMEYDVDTGAWKPVVSFEDTIAVTITGASIEITPGEFVRITGSVAIWDPTTNTLARVTADGRVEVNVAGTIAQSNLTTPAQYAEDSPHASGQTGTFVLGVRQDDPSALASAGDYSPFLTDALGRLHIFTSGSFVRLDGDIQIGAVEIKDGETDQRAVVHGGGSVYTDVQELGPALPLDSDSNSNVGYSGTFVGAQIVGPSGGSLMRRVSTAVDDDAANRAIQFSLITAADLRGFNGVTWDRLRVDSQYRLQTRAFVTGTVVIDPTSSFALNRRADVAIASPVASLLADNVAPTVIPTGVAVASYGHLLGADTGEWDRLYGVDNFGANGLFYTGDPTIYPNIQPVVASLFVEQAGAPDNRELLKNDLQGRLLTRAFVTGTVVVDPASTLALNQRADVAIASPVRNLNADVLSTAATGVLTAAHLFGYDEVDDSWNRARLIPVADGAATAAVSPALVAASTLMLYEENNDVWYRARSFAADMLVDNISGSYLTPGLLAAAALGYAFDGNTWDRVGIDTTRRLMTSALVSGSVTTLPGSSMSLNQRADVAIASPVAQLGDDQSPNTTGINSASHLMGFYEINSQWYRLRVAADIAGALTTNELLPALSTYATLAAFNLSTAQMNTLAIDTSRRLMTSALVTGSVTVLPGSSLALNQRADVAIASPVQAHTSDTVDENSTGVITAAFLHAFDEGAGFFVRPRAVSTGDALAELDVLPSLGVAGFGYLFDSVANEWNRWRGNLIRGARTDLISGSFPWKNMVRAAVTISGSGGEATLVAAVPGQRIHVMEAMLVTDANNQITFKSGAGGAILSGPHTLPNSGDGYFLGSPTNPDHFHFRTVAGQALVLDRSQISLLGGHINYFLEP